MKKILALAVLASFSSLLADQYGNGGGYCSSCNSGGGNYSEQYNNSGYGGRGGQEQSNSRNYQGQMNNSSRSLQNAQIPYYNPNEGQEDHDTHYRSVSSQPAMESVPPVAKIEQKPVSDQEIKSQIHDKLRSGWFTNGFHNATYDVSNGNVTLRGSVDTLENKAKIEESVKRIVGVKQVSNQISVQKEAPDAYSEAQLQASEKKFPKDVATTPADRQTNAEIRDKLNNGWLSKGYETLIITTKDGEVIISGVVDTPEDVKNIGDSVKEIGGVKSVKNQLSVKPK